MTLLPSTPHHLSTGHADLDSILGEVWPGDTFLWLVEDPASYPPFARTLLYWAGTVRLPSAFLDFGSPVLHEVLRTCQMHADFPPNFSLNDLARQVEELAFYPRNETLCFFFDFPPLSGQGAQRITPELYLDFLGKVCPMIHRHRHLAYFVLDEGSLTRQFRESLGGLAKIILHLRGSGDDLTLTVEKAEGRFTQAMFNPHQILGKRLLERPIQDEALYVSKVEDKLAELAAVQQKLRVRVEEYEQSENTFLSILANTTEAILFVDLEGHIRTWNKGAERIFGFSQEEAVGKSFFEFIVGSSEPDAEMQEIVRKLREKTYINHLIVPTTSKNGRKIYVDLTNSQLKDAYGRIRGTSIIMREITDRVHSERQLTHMLRELSLLQEVSRLLLGSRDLQGILEVILLAVTSSLGLGFDRGFIMLYDKAKEELRGAFGLGAVDAVEAERTWSEIRSQGATSLEELYRNFRARSGPVDEPFNRKLRSYFVPRRESEHFLFRILNRGTARIIRIPGHDSNERAFLDAIGCAACAISPMVSENTPIGLLIVDYTISQKLITDDEVDFLSLIANHASSAVRRAQLHEELKERLKQLERVTGELRTNQEHMLKFERLRTVGEMAARVAHEIRNPLAAVGGLAKVLKRKATFNEAESRYIDIIINEIGRLEHIVQEIQTFTKGNVLDLELADLNETVDSVLTMADPQICAANVEVIRSYASLPQVVHDPSRLKQVLLNLVLNAVQALEHLRQQPGERDLSHWRPRLTLGTSQHENHVAITVTDNGPGMSAEVLERIREPFFTTKSSGSGLGVTIASQLIEAHNGFLIYESTPGVGTTVTVKLPLRRELPVEPKVGG